jgi:DNA polymerase III delta prime subunit
MNKRIYDLISNDINTYEKPVNKAFGGNEAIFKIFDSFFNNLQSNEKISKDCGVILDTALYSNLLYKNFDINEDSTGNDGIGFLIKFDGIKFSVRFKKFRDGQDMVYSLNIKSISDTKYSGTFIHKYLLYCALETSNLKGSYFTMPRNSFSWDIKDLEKRTFDDIYLPEEMMEDLKLYVNIYKKSGKVLRYLKVGNPGVGKTESTVVIANELNLEGVTIIKTPICQALYQKVELANVLAPALIILDDIDLSLGDRNSGAYSELLGVFLDVMDGTDKLSANVGVIATTNAAHLLDLAAQRPGRFDKTLLYNEITKDNIKNIILKSLKLNFGKASKGEIKLYSDDRIVNEFHESRVSGSHVYNCIKMLKLRYDTLEITDVDVDRIIKSIRAEIKVIEEVRKISFLKERFDKPSGGSGFDTSNAKGLTQNIEYEVEENPIAKPSRRSR